MNTSQDAASAPDAGDNDAAVWKEIRDAHEDLMQADDAELVEAFKTFAALKTRLKPTVRFRLMKEVIDEKEKLDNGQTTKEEETKPLNLDSLLREIGEAPLLKLSQALKRLSRQGQYNAAIAAQLICEELDQEYPLYADGRRPLTSE
ncbi:hypothetical protein PSEUBRA_005230 [Kalmanozyma brasiliensis GHG001]|uniref:uncharacterized protein n=1 Tax=Kalmanozyma brasiliensis (strain GHG001) TaxID=1365824 RepID=UPI002867E637|nr:uncharacterized protein PSEUBRA_005230 [Kalmanozyma brasiliensis GHG001]KAF6767492.1 hypothetical protein PSEUBRA_005230 [Kalmanozyma brasiliensis GHG001]